MNKIKPGCFVECIKTRISRNSADTHDGTVYEVIGIGSSGIQLNCSTPNFKFDPARFVLYENKNVYPTINKEYFKE